MRKLRPIIFVTLILILCSMTAHASTDLISDTDEWELIQIVVEGSSFLGENGSASSGTASLDEKLENPVSANEGYKLYALMNPDFVNYLADGSAVGELITDEYVWIVPKDSNGQIRVVNKDGEWKVAGYSTPSSPTAVTDMIQVADVRIAAQTLSEDTAVVQMQCFEAPFYHTNFVLLTMADGEERLIPYGSRPDLTGLENGKAYSVAEVCEILGETFGTDSDANSGMPSFATGEDNPGKGSWLLIVLTAGGLVLAAGVVLKQRKYSK